MSTAASISRRDAVTRISGTVGAALSLPLLGHSTGHAADGLPHVAVPNDRRLGPLKDLNGYFPFEPPTSREAWLARRAWVQRQILLSCGLWPMPARDPVEATVHGAVERDGYTVERVFFESSPGLFVTGSLYRPAQPSGRLPAILCPHGHFSEGRFHAHSDDELQKELESGAEKFPQGGRHPLQARCVQLARMGCLVFLYDMQGYADGGSFTNELIHGFSKQRPDLSSPSQWGLFSAQAELRLLNAFGLQTWNSIRALDWLTARDDVDLTRVGVTGASGGGTQTFILAAMDERITAAFPAVMVSTAMQGGCTCENASYLRVNTGNIELAALIAPRPLGMTGADDWTVDIETKGLPQLQQLYALLGAPDHVVAKYFKFPHNYNAVSRQMMYEFFNQHFKLVSGAIDERDFVPLTRDEATVFNEQYPAPVKDAVTEISVLRTLDRQSRETLGALFPGDAQRWSEYRRVVGSAWQIMIGRELPAAGDLEYELITETDRGTWQEYAAWLRHVPHGEELPTAFALPKAWNHEVVIWLSAAGKREMLPGNGTLTDVAASLVERGYAIATADLLYQGDFLANGLSMTHTRSVNNPREFLGYTVGYNHPLFAQRVHDILTLLAFAKHHESQPRKIHLVGTGSAGLWATAAAAVVSQANGPQAVDRLLVETGGYRFAKITEIRDPNLIPGAVKYGDLPGLLALCAPIPLTIAGEPVPTLTNAAYQTAGGTVASIPATGKLVAQGLAAAIGTS